MAIAVKVLPRAAGLSDNGDVRELENEIALMQTLDHPNIVRYLGCEVNPEHLFIFQEWVPCGSLASVITEYGALREPVVRRYLRQILQGLKYLHSNRVVHRDVKGGNVLVNEFGVAKLADFGCSRRMGEGGTLEESRVQSMKGTPYFMAPEVIQNDRVGRPSDIWSLGCVAYQMASGEPPWKRLQIKTPMVLFYHVVNCEVCPPMRDEQTGAPLFSPLLEALMRRCFERAVAKRASAVQLLEDPFLTGSIAGVSPPSVAAKTRPLSTLSTSALSGDGVKGRGDNQERGRGEREEDGGEKGRVEGLLAERESHDPNVGESLSRGARPRAGLTGGYGATVPLPPPTPQSDDGGNWTAGMGLALEPANAITSTDLVQRSARTKGEAGDGLFSRFDRSDRQMADGQEVVANEDGDKGERDQGHKTDDELEEIFNPAGLARKENYRVQGSSGDESCDSRRAASKSPLLAPGTSPQEVSSEEGSAPAATPPPKAALSSSVSVEESNSVQNVCDDERQRRIMQRLQQQEKNPHNILKSIPKPSYPYGDGRVVFSSTGKAAEVGCSWCDVRGIVEA